MSRSSNDTRAAGNLPEPAELEGSKKSSDVDSAHHQREAPWDVVTAYLKSNSPELQELEILREQGWRNPQGDEYFRRQRQSADNAGHRLGYIFYNLMQRIGGELNAATSAFDITTDRHHEPMILDLCMAPGGFLNTAMTLNPEARAVALSLPIGNGGHRCLMPMTPRIETHFVDVTMLAADMGTVAIPHDHPDAGKFLPRVLPPERVFDLVLCDGQVLRNHTMAPYREKCEARRLTASQLALGLERLKPGGTVIILMHRFESWGSIQTLYTFSRFAEIVPYKPTAGHVKRSSFYLVAKNVQSDSAEALSAVQRWKETWHDATFPGAGDGKKDGEGEGLEWQGSHWTPEEIIENFGPEMLRIGAQIWKTQATALAKAPFIKGNIR